MQWLQARAAGCWHVIATDKLAFGCYAVLEPDPRHQNSQIELWEDNFGLIRYETILDVRC